MDPNHYLTTRQTVATTLMPVPPPFTISGDTLPVSSIMPVSLVASDIDIDIDSLNIALRKGKCTSTSDSIVQFVLSNHLSLFIRWFIIFVTVVYVPKLVLEAFNVPS